MGARSRRVSWTGKLPIPGSAEAVSRLLDRGHEVVFVTNNSPSQPSASKKPAGSDGDRRTRPIHLIGHGRRHVGRARRAGVRAGRPGDRRGRKRSGRSPDRRHDLVALDGVDAVLVGLDWHLSYDRLRFAVQSVAGGARFIATNTDPTYPNRERLLSRRAGAIVAPSAATGQQPIIAGKPHEPQADLVRARFGSDGIMVGD
ncbi:MAG: hypothetical protein R2710_29645 [Acidimicrobiales bacterium]